jgi:hypothetical protein
VRSIFGQPRGVAPTTGRKASHNNIKNQNVNSKITYKNYKSKRVYPGNGEDCPSTGKQAIIILKIKN